MLEEEESIISRLGFTMRPKLSKHASTNQRRGGKHLFDRKAPISEAIIRGFTVCNNKRMAY